MYTPLFLIVGVTSDTSAKTYYNDSWAIKSLVLLVWALDSTHQGQITHTIYTYLVTEYGNPEQLGKIVPSLIVS